MDWWNTEHFKVKRLNMALTRKNRVSKVEEKCEGEMGGKASNSR